MLFCWVMGFGSHKIIIQYNTISKPHYNKKFIHFSWYLAICFRGTA